MTKGRGLRVKTNGKVCWFFFFYNLQHGVCKPKTALVFTPVEVILGFLINAKWAL
jgi:hypothetical protein